MERRGVTLAGLLKRIAFGWVVVAAGLLLFRAFTPVQRPWWFGLFGGAIPSAFCMQSGIQLEDARLSRWSLLGIHFDGARLTNVDLRGAELIGCDFRGARLRNVDFSGARLERVDLEGAQLERVTLEDAGWGPTTYDRTTLWPAGFDPQAHGARLAE